MLEEDGISAEAGVEDTQVKEAFDGHKHDGDSNHRRAQNHDKAGRVVGPDEERQAIPSQAGSAHAVDGDDEIQPRKDRREACDEDGESRFNNVSIAADSAVRSVEGPTSVHAAI